MRLSRTHMQGEWRWHKHRSPLFLITYVKAPDGVFRATVSVSKKNVPTAVERNYTKRCIRSLLNKYTEYPLWILITMSRNAITAPAADLRKEFERFLAQVKGL